MSKPKKEWTDNEAIEMMHNNTSKALKSIAEFAIKNDYTAEDIINFLLETGEEMAAQALVVKMRDELKFDKPIDGE